MTHPVCTALTACVWLFIALPGQAAPPREAVKDTESPAVELPRGALARIGHPRLRHGGAVFLVRYSADGKLLASAGLDKVIRLWDAATGNELRRFEGHEGPVASVAFAPDGKALVSGSGDGTIRLWDTATGKETQALKGHGAYVLPVVFSPDGKTIASEAQDKTVRVWEVAGGKELLKLAGHKSNGTSNVVFSPDGALLVAVGEDHAINLWDVKSGKILRQCKGHSADAESLAFSRDGKTLVSGSVDTTIRLWEIETGKELRKIDAGGTWVNGVAISPNGKVLAAACQNGLVRLFDAQTGKDLRLWRAHNDRPKTVDFSPDGKTLASGAIDGTLRLWDVATGEEAWQSGEAIAAMALSPDGKLLAAAGRARAVRLFDPRTGKELRVLGGVGTNVRGLAFSPDGRRLAAAGDDFIIQRWDTESGEALRPLEGHKARVQSWGLTFARDGKTLFSHDDEGTWRLWDSATARELPAPKGLANLPRFARLTPDGRFAVSTAANNQAITLHDPTSGKELREFVTKGVISYQMGAAPEGFTLAIAGQDGNIRLWEVFGSALRAQLPTKGIRPIAGAFSHDGRVLAWSGIDYSVHLTELSTGKELRKFVGHGNVPFTCAWAPAGSFLVSCSSDGSAIVWDTTGVWKDLQPRTGRRTAAELEALWKDLAGEDGAKAYQAAWALDEAPDQAAALLREQVRPATAVKVDAARVAKLIAELDADEVDSREAATEALTRLGLAAEEALRGEQTKGPASAEARLRIQSLLDKLYRGTLSPEERAGLRAVEVLERLGTREARETLAALTKGAPNAMLTQEARAALGRLTPADK